jgi:hypothetical protein
MNRPLISMLLVAGTVVFCSSVRAQQQAAAPVPAEKVQNMLAAQIRMQGFACDKSLGAVKNTKRSRPDHDVWVLRCSNASYRISRAPDMAARVEPVR